MLALWIGLSACIASPIAPADAAQHAPVATVFAPSPPPYLPGREEDARVADLAFRLATRAALRCPVTVPALGFALQHLTQFELPDRAGLAATLALDRGPGVTLVVPDSPAAVAGMRAGDVLLAVGGTPLPPEEARDLPFVAARAHARADAILDRIDAGARAAAGGALSISVLREGTTLSLSLAPRPACPSRVHLARSVQRNAFADGTHVFVTTGLLARLRGDDEVAFFLAHEMAHNILGHAAVMRGGDVRRGLGRTLGKSGAIIRGVERDADRLGALMMHDAGLDPVSGAQALLRLDGGMLDGPFGEHDSPAARIAAVRAAVAAP
ncbi:hypothetical protein ASE86_14240 [Sphingomonas sp. Leaf33]|uniref:M48 family metallopeptidase n=1 Tax=Sphingomonas sp. Leaf33 TaxID=1736215 RepID=UPI0006F859E6|nr:M48 family metallopeptidase [Sphingomonas sp. Leaf33]KQN22933.1 hypothetical protein ASE86_14240 [Sphingomonas sp. Leaf33]